MVRVINENFAYGGTSRERDHLQGASLAAEAVRAPDHAPDASLLSPPLWGASAFQSPAARPELRNIARRAARSRHPGHRRYLTSSLTKYERLPGAHFQVGCCRRRTGRAHRVPRPVNHHIPPLVEKVAAPAGCFDLVTDRMRESRFRHPLRDSPSPQPQISKRKRAARNSLPPTHRSTHSETRVILTWVDLG